MLGAVRCTATSHIFIAVLVCSCVQDEWLPHAALERSSEVERTQHELDVLKQVAEDTRPRLP